jgi:hypothetical protein
MPKEMGKNSKAPTANMLGSNSKEPVIMITLAAVIEEITMPTWLPISEDGFGYA